MELIFNSKTGELFERFLNEPLTHFHIPPKEAPRSNCKKCFGRFYTNKKPDGSFNLCPSCVRKCIDLSKYSGNVSQVRLQNQSN